MKLNQILNNNKQKFFITKQIIKEDIVNSQIIILLKLKSIILNYIIIIYNQTIKMKHYIQPQLTQPSRKRLSHFKQKLQRQISLASNPSSNNKQQQNQYKNYHQDITMIYSSIMQSPYKSTFKSKTIEAQDVQQQITVNTAKPALNNQSSKMIKKQEEGLHVRKDRRFKIFKPRPLLQRIQKILKIEDQRYKKLGILGEGGSSYVFLVLDLQTKQKMVMKQYKKDSRRALKQYLIGKSLNHPNLPYYYTHQSNYILMQYIQAQKPVSGNNIWLLYQLADSIMYLHTNKICHTDIKPKNTIITKNNKLKLIDFGNSMKGQVWKKGRSGTFGYMAPEMFQTGEWNGKEVDIWAFGVVCKQWKINVLAQYCMTQRKIRPKIEDILKHPIFTPYRNINLQKEKENQQ